MAAPGRLALLLAVAGLALLPAPRAEPAAALQWYQHYERGLERAAAGDWAAALEDLRAAERMEPRPRERVRTYGNRFLFGYDPAYHQARALAALERWDEAAAALDRSDAAAVTAEGERDALRRRLEAGRQREDRPAEPPTGRLRVESEPPGAEVRVDGRLAGRTPLPLILPAGRHRVELRREGAAPWSEMVEVRSGEAGRLSVVLPAAGSGAGPVGTTEGAEGSRPGGEERGAGSPAESGTAGGGREVGGLPGAEPAASGLAGSPDAVAGDGAPRAGTGTAEAGSGGAGTVGGDLLRRASPGGARTGPSSAGPSSAGPSSTDPSSTGPVAGSPSAGDASTIGDDDGRSDADGTVPSAPLSTGVLPTGVLAGGVLGLLALAALVAAARDRLRPPAPPHPGQRRAAWRLHTGADRRIGGYHVLDELGRGGMATTYRARRVRDGKTLALKIPHESGDPTFAERFVREGRLGETLHHPAIVRIHEAGEDRGLAFLAMELLPGRTLEEEIAAHPEGLPPVRALEIARRVAEALDYAHGKGIVHRDLKPANVMLLPEGGLKVMDFGVARVEGQPGLTTSRVFFGSPVYAAPELVEPSRIGPRSDLYSLGIVLFEMLEGEPPFRDESVFRLLEMHRSRPLPVPEELPRPVPAATWAVVARLCAKDPDRRYPDAEALLVDLNRLLYAMGEDRPGSAADGAADPEARVPAGPG